MTDSLRTRIATAIMQSCHGVYMDDAVNAADAVIRELQLEIDYGSTYDVGGVAATAYRYISKWWVTADE